jgi:hypothetical protein
MPSNPIDDFLQGLDPIDAATLLAGIRNSVPLGMMFRSGELNEGHDAELARRRGPAAAPAAPTIDPVESNRRAQMDFEMQYPDPRIREFIINERLKELRNPYSPTTATRRRDFEEAPMSAQQYMSAAPKKKKFANGGAIDFTIPDMQDGGRFIPDPQPYNKGGGVKKTLDQMMAEMAQKGTKVADKPDLARRGFLGLGKASDFPLAKMDTKALEKMQSDLKGAPTITEKSVTIDPGKGAAKSTLKSLSETPMSRREVLQSAAGQVMRGVLPELGGLGNVAKVAESVAPQAYEASAIPGLMAALMRTGMSPDEAGAMVEKLIPKAPQGWPTMVGDRIKAPAENMPHVGQDTPLMSIFGEMVRPAFQNGPYSVRPEMRDLRRLSPEDYEALKETARDIKQYGHEN